MDIDDLRGQAVAAFRDLEVPDSVTFESLRELLEEDRGKRIVIRPVRHLGQDRVSGLWLSLPRTDLILHAETASELHRQQIILHEFAHMVLDHGLREDGTQFAALLPELDPEVVARCLARCQDHSHEEVAAEALADLFAAAIARTRRASRDEPLNFRGVFG
ncbi:hypothetical protein [Sinomonas halotolerans]|uniref:IrrE N-terminal-like domain-containing protein n=1 Tax=Sinomonas halotolerans TaxID=1644133 RepID=A0ABU9WYP6_9MICC